MSRAADSNWGAPHPASDLGVCRALSLRTESPGSRQSADRGHAGDRRGWPRAAAYTAGRATQLLRARGVNVASAEKRDITGSLARTCKTFRNTRPRSAVNDQAPGQPIPIFRGRLRSASLGSGLSRRRSRVRAPSAPPFASEGLAVKATQVVHSGVSGNNGGYHTNPTFLEELPNEDPS